MKNTDSVTIVLGFLVALLVVALITVTSNFHLLRKQAVSLGHAEYNLKGEWSWKIKGKE